MAMQVLVSMARLFGLKREIFGCSKSESSKQEPPQCDSSAVRNSKNSAAIRFPLNLGVSRADLYLPENFSVRARRDATKHHFSLVRCCVVACKRVTAVNYAYLIISILVLVVLA